MPPSNDRPAQAIIQYIQEHYCENLSIAGLAEQFGFSANYVSSLLKQELGILLQQVHHPAAFKPRERASSGNPEIGKEITEICGYYSQSHFTKLFMEHEGCTPAEFRKGFRQSQMNLPTEGRLLITVSPFCCPPALY